MYFNQFYYIINSDIVSINLFEHTYYLQLDGMFKSGSGCRFSLTKNSRADFFSWSTHCKNSEKAYRKNII